MMIPIIFYYLNSYRILEVRYELPFHTFIQVFLSVPVLIILGIILFFKFKHRIGGAIFLFMGLLWLWAIIYELMTKN